MKTQKAQTIIGVFLLALAVAAYFIVTNLSSNEEPVSESEAERMNGIVKDEILSISFNGTEEQLTFTRADADFEWILQNHEDRTVASSYVEYALNASCGIIAQTKIEDVTDYSEFGFDEPECTVTLKTASETHVLKYGLFNSAINAYYVMQDDDPTVYVYIQTDLPFTYETEHFLEAVESETEEDATAENEDDAEADEGDAGADDGAVVENETDAEADEGDAGAVVENEDAAEENVSEENGTEAGSSAD